MRAARQPSLVAVAWSALCWSVSVWAFALSAELRSLEMPSSVPASAADPPAVAGAAVPDVADTDGGGAGVVPDVAARLHPVSASATAIRTAALTRWRFT